jgi:hypothetical protein
LSAAQLTITTGVGSETLSSSGATIFSKNVADNSTNYVNAVTLENGTGANAGLASNYKAPAVNAAAAGKNTVALDAKEVALAAAKTYDGNKNLSAAQLTITTGVGSETLSSSGATIFSKNVADNSTNYVDAVSLTDGTNGGKASNYKAPSAAVAAGKNTVALTPKELTALYTATNKVYDGNTNATVTGTLTDIVTGDAVTATHSSATFNTAVAGTNKTVTVAGIALTGGDASNYKLDPGVNLGNKASAKASITAAPSIAPAPAPVVPTSASSSGGRVKIPTPEANPFQLASNGGLVEEDFCSDTNDASCACEETSQDKEVQFCTSKNSE